MSAFGPKRTSLAALHMSAFGGKADIAIAVSCIWPGPDPRRALWPAALRVPHEQAEHMAAPTKAANVKKALAKAPSTRDPKRTSTAVPIERVRGPFKPLPKG